MPEGSLILVVDDNESARYAKCRTLRRAGFEVIEAANGTDALRLVGERRPRLVLLDVQLPDVDGFEVCRRVKSDPATASVLILQVSATYVRDEDTVRALEGGADASLTEPVDPTVLIATVRALLRARQAEDAIRNALNLEQAARAVAEEANRTKDEFLATLSHELRSPLGAILTWVTLLRSGRVDAARTPHALEVIERNTRLQVKLIDDLLDVSRIISGKMRLEVGLVDLAVVLNAALDAVRPAAEAKGIRLISAPVAPFGPISGDAGRLQQVVWNLLSNAVKFTPRGGRVEVELDTEDSRAQIRVRDNGRGIDPAFLPYIFERFRQADASSTRAEGGLGLGLAIVRQLVELHGGTVVAESAGPGQGATFIVSLPLPAVRLSQPDARARDAALARAEVGAPRGLDGVRVLIVDDDRDAREAVAAVLEEWGASATSAANVQDALQLLASGEVDLLVSDIAMPGEDGYVLIRAVRARERGRSAHVPALALTAYAGADEERRAFAAGFDNYLAKPVDARELVSVAQALVRR
jgi:signal transduction histidine kinase